MSTSVAAIGTCVVTLKDVTAAAKACREESVARKEAADADAAKKTAYMKVFEALLGVKTEDEVKALSPDKLVRLARRRIKKGDVILDGIDAEVLLEKVIQKSQARRNVSWKDCFVAVLGESKATEIVNATDESYSYKFVESALS